MTSTIIDANAAFPVVRVPTPAADAFSTRWAGMSGLDLHFPRLSSNVGSCFLGLALRLRIVQRFATFAPTRCGCHVATETPQQSRDGAIEVTSRFAGAESVGLDAAPSAQLGLM